MQLGGGGLPRFHKGTDLYTGSIQLREDDLVAPVPPFPGHLHGPQQHRMLRIHIQPQNMQLMGPFVIQLHPGQHRDPQLLPLCHRFLHAGDAVVVAESHQRQPGSGSHANDLRRRIGAVRMTAVDVQIKSVGHGLPWMQAPFFECIRASGFARRPF